MSESTGGERIPLLPLRDIVVFPHMVVPLFVGRPKSIQALEDAMAGDRQLVVAAQRVAGEEDPTPEDFGRPVFRGRRRAARRREL